MVDCDQGCVVAERPRRGFPADDRKFAEGERGGAGEGGGCHRVADDAFEPGNFTCNAKFYSTTISDL